METAIETERQTERGRQTDRQTDREFGLDKYVVLERLHAAIAAPA